MGFAPFDTKRYRFISCAEYSIRNSKTQWFRIEIRGSRKIALVSLAPRERALRTPAPAHETTTRKFGIYTWDGNERTEGWFITQSISIAILP
jgi:hypothetical protein